MVKVEILWNEKLKEYTYREEVEGVKSIKREPIRFKPEDRTSKYRKDILKKEILESK